MMDAIALIIGIVVGTGIFSFPSLVAANVANAETFIFVWLLGGAVSLIGVLCYAELSSAFPHTGGDYHFLRRAFGERLSFLYAWARISVIQTGSIAILSIIFGDYLSQIYSLGELSPMIYAAGLISALTLINIIGLSFGTGTQKLLTTLQITGVIAIIFAGLVLAPEAAPSALTSTPVAQTTTLGLAMVFVLFTFGGWNEAAYVSAEMKKGGGQTAKALIFGIVAITAMYALVNLAYLNVLGLDGIAASQTVAGDAIRATFGEQAAWAIGLLVALAAVTSANATMFTGARTNYALGNDYPALGVLGRWNKRADSPVNAFIVQGLIALALVGLSVLTREGIGAIIEYTAPVFWFFFLLVGISLFVLRWTEPDVVRPFRVPLYPVTPLIFCFTSAYLLYSSLVYTGMGSLVGVGVLVLGGLVLGFLTFFGSPSDEIEIEIGSEKDEVTAI